jgi:peptidoglycan/LPS O-acetylase OafA/YrhL
LQAHRNNVGLLRLILASLVVVGHSPEIIDGNRSREPLTALFHTLSLGEVAVDGFFLLSGFLITKSMMRSGNLSEYLWRRIMRIVPGYIVAFLLCVMVLAPIVGGHPYQHAGDTIKRLLTLRAPPGIPGALEGMPNTALNGSLWTIAYEFRCYILVAALWVVGLLKRRFLMLGLTVVMVLGSILMGLEGLEAPAIPDAVETLVGELNQTLRLTETFLVGMCICLFWSEIQVHLIGRVAAVCTVCLVACMFEPHLAEPALITLGAYILFWLGMKADFGRLQPINDKWDISYGVYLYGWPIATALLWFNRGISPWLLEPAALTLSVLAGTASWWLVEKKTKDLDLVQNASTVRPHL